MGDFVSVEDCYSVASVSGSDFVGGFIGTIQLGVLKNCYSSGVVASTGVADAFACETTDREPPGLDSIQSCYFNSDLSNVRSSDYGEPKTSSEMKTQATFEGWDFDEVWFVREGRRYPRLRGISPPAPVVVLDEGAFIDADILLRQEGKWKPARIFVLGSEDWVEPD